MSANQTNVPCQPQRSLRISCPCPPPPSRLNSSSSACAIKVIRAELLARRLLRDFKTLLVLVANLDALRTPVPEAVVGILPALVTMPRFVFFSPPQTKRQS